MAQRKTVELEQSKMGASGSTGEEELTSTLPLLPLYIHTYVPLK